ncbi:HEPN domain-containing protein [Rhizorhapis sp. SPR117]|uniref:HEPN domain-containing protein n=1 Tax=Rhizorhapis sp. SPR117 TaxID=2912611 RepID=UPI001F47E2EB|nr:HEPN domain-containing protein [Rhizorhapis sp. SPR117]
MRTDLDHLPADRRRELGDFVLRTILTAFEDAHASSVTGWKKKGRIHKIVLYGSFARGGWVYEPHTKKAYSSDYDLLVMVNRKQVVDNIAFWSALEDRFLKARAAGRIKSLPSMIVHTRQEVHSALSRGRYFFMDIVKDGILLYDADDVEFPKPKPKTPSDKVALAEEYFGEWYPSAGEFYDDFSRNLELSRTHKAAFELHQCVEHLYNAVLLTLTFYAPRNHNIKALRGMADKLDRRLAYVWPSDFHWQRAAFNILRDAYVKARYARPGYKITVEQLRWLGEITQNLSEAVRIVCQEHIAALKAEAMHSVDAIPVSVRNIDRAVEEESE